MDHTIPFALIKGQIFLDIIHEIEIPFPFDPYLKTMQSIHPKDTSSGLLCTLNKTK